MAMDTATRYLVLKLSAVAVLMFAFAVWILPPMYTLLCEVTGLRKVGGAYEAVETQIDTSRTVTVQFVATHNHNVPWEFRPLDFSMEVHPGETVNSTYFAKNLSNVAMVAQAIPSIMPFAATNYFHKIECFCFNNQPLAAGETAELGLQFVVDQDLPKQVKTIILSYTLFDITNQAAPAVSIAP